jgi:glutathione S-transferase
MTLKLIGWARSRARRCIWALKELGVEWEHDAISHTDPRLKTDEYAAVNPEGRVPVLIDGDFALDESLVINLYLTKKFGLGTFYPERPEQEAMAWRWSFWAQSELEPHLATIFYHRFLWPEDKRNPELAAAAEAALQKPLASLDKALEGRDWLVGHRFTVADLNVANVLAPNRVDLFSLGRFDNVRAWLVRCYQRPAAIAALKMAS